jgi:NAD(P)-dependent dehydrogenase (short-subunit alcohol dehydrogenase family)
MTWRIEGKRILITGASAGIGRATALAMAERGAVVTITSRDSARGAEAARALSRRSGQEVDSLVLELSDLRKVAEAAGTFAARAGKLDVLINNAGAFFAPLRDGTEGIEATLAVNHLGPFCLTGLLLPLLEAAAPARIIMVASDAHRSAVGLPHLCPAAESGARTPFQAYAASKLANILFARALARRLEGRNITVNALHPGVVRTRLGSGGDATGPTGLGIRLFLAAGISPRRGARASVELAFEPALSSTSGAYFVGGLMGTRRKEPSAQARDDALGEKLWRDSMAVVTKVLGESVPFDDRFRRAAGPAEA